MFTASYRTQISFVFLVIPLLFTSGRAHALQTCTLLLTTEGRDFSFVSEMALEPAERERGLMGRKTLSPHHAMFFDLGEMAHVSMWMKDTLIPLDMVFFGEDGRLLYLSNDTTPLSLSLITPPVAVRYILEVNAGEGQSFSLDTHLNQLTLSNCLSSLARAPK